MHYPFLNIIGLMTGTSMDGIDISLVKTNGIELKRLNKNFYYKYSSETKTILNDIPAVKSVSDNEVVLDVEAEVQDISAERQDQLGDRVNDIANDNAMAGIKDDLV